MKRTLSKFLLFVALFIPFTHLFAAVETYTLDPMHTYVLWHINHFGFSNPSGKWFAEGSLVLDKDKPQNNKVNAIIHIANIVTGIPDLDKHLMGPLFFDVTKFPTATFVSDKIDVTGKETATVYGILILHGVSNPITLNVTLNKAGGNPITNKMSVGFSANTIIKRSSFGINTLLPGLGDEVTINIEAEAYK